MYYVINKHFHIVMRFQLALQQDFVKKRNRIIVLKKFCMFVALFLIFKP